MDRTCKRQEPDLCRTERPSMCVTLSVFYQERPSSEPVHSHLYFVDPAKHHINAEYSLAGPLILTLHMP